MNNQPFELEHVKKYMYSGKAILTIKSTVSGRHFTYLIEKAKNSGAYADVYFIKVLTGEDNTNLDLYKYFGFLKYDFFNFATEKSKIGADAKSVLAFQYAWKIVTGEIKDDRVEFYHMGKCGRCGKPLTTPESVKMGLGEICANK